MRAFAIGVPGATNPHSAGPRHSSTGSCLHAGSGLGLECSPDLACSLPNAASRPRHAGKNPIRCVSIPSPRDQGNGDLQKGWGEHVVQQLILPPQPSGTIDREIVDAEGVPRPRTAILQKHQREDTPRALVLPTAAVSREDVRNSRTGSGIPDAPIYTPARMFAQGIEHRVHAIEHLFAQPRSDGLVPDYQFPNGINSARYRGSEWSLYESVRPEPTATSKCSSPPL